MKHVHTGGLTPPSSGQLSASRQLPLMSNVSCHRARGRPSLMNAGSHRSAAAVPSSEWAARPLASGEPAVQDQEVHCQRSLELSVLRRPAGGSGSAGAGAQASCATLKEHEGQSRLGKAGCVSSQGARSVRRFEALPRRCGPSVSAKPLEERHAPLLRYRGARCHDGKSIRAFAHLAANPSIERTCPGKPGHAAHVERWAS
jgi:hypothetical protein